MVVPRLAIASALVMFGVAACGGHAADRADQGRSIAGKAGLPSDVGDFFALATTAGNATYKLTVATVDANGKPIQIATTQRPPDKRVDVFEADGTIDTTIARGDQSVQCTMSGSTWQCGALGPAPSSSTGVFDQTTVQRAIDAFRQRAADYDFRVEQRSIAGASARCLVTTRKPGHEQDATLGASATLCLSPEGVPLLVQVPTGTLTAVEYTTDVPDTAFDPPAPVGGGSSAPDSSTGPSPST